MGASRVIVQGLRPPLLMFKSVANNSVTSVKSKNTGLWEYLGTDVWRSACQDAFTPFVAALVLEMILLILHK